MAGAATDTDFTSSSCEAKDAAFIAKDCMGFKDLQTFLIIAAGWRARTHR
jgi:hypothetical protein